MLLPTIISAQRDPCLKPSNRNYFSTCSSKVRQMFFSYIYTIRAKCNADGPQCPWISNQHLLIPSKGKALESMDAINILEMSISYLFIIIMTQ